MIGGPMLINYVQPSEEELFKVRSPCQSSSSIKHMLVIHAFISTGIRSS